MNCVSVEAIGCKQLAQGRYAAAPWPGIELATYCSQARRPTIAPPHHHDTIRDSILTCARKPTRVSLIYRTLTSGIPREETAAERTSAAGRAEKVK